MVTDTDRAYAAGLMDGEGTIGIYRRHEIKSCYTLRVRIGMTDSSGIGFLARAFGGKVTISRTLPSGKVFKYWDLYSRAAEQFLREIVPFLHVKRSQAELAIRFRETMMPGKNRTPSAKEIQDRAFVRIRELNNCKKGVVKV